MDHLQMLGEFQAASGDDQELCDGGDKIRASCIQGMSLNLYVNSLGHVYIFWKKCSGFHQILKVLYVLEKKKLLYVVS